MRRPHRRILAVAVVVATGLGSLAHALRLTSDTSTTTAPAGKPMAIVVTVRNDTTGAVTITNIVDQSGSGSGSGGGSCQPPAVTVSRIGAGSQLGVTLNPDQFAQYVFAAPAGLSTSQACDWTIETDAGNEPLQTMFNVSATSTEDLDAQPHDLAMGYPSATFETQQLRVVNYLSTMHTVDIDLNTQTVGDAQLTFVGGACDGQTACTSVTLAPSSITSLTVKCTKLLGSGTGSGVISYVSGGSETQTQVWECTGAGTMTGSGVINIVEPTITLSGTQGMIATGSASIEGDSSALASATLTDAAFRFRDTALCGMNPQACTPSPALALPAQLAIECTPDGTERVGMLVVMGTMADLDIAAVRCQTSGSGAVLDVSPTTLDAMTVPVGQTSAPLPFTIRNIGTESLTALVTPSAPTWQVDACAGTPCTIVGAGSGQQQVNATFRPASYGPDSATLSITSNAGNDSVVVNGVGLGAELAVLAPDPDNRIELGTIGRGQLVGKSVTLASAGNQTLAVEVGAADPPAPPFSTSAAQITVAANDTAQVEVRCQSDTPGGPHQDTISISSNAYRTNGSAAGTVAVTARCTIADTVVQVMPSALDFGEVRKGTGPRTLEVTITNPGPPVMLRSVKLSRSVAGLTLIAPPAGMLATNVPVAAQLVLASDDELVLSDVELRIAVDADLALPISGRVVTPRAYVTPDVLDLGTACVGSSVTGNVLLVNTGTATLRVQPPAMDQAFTPLFVAPTTYPDDGTGAPLAPSSAAVAGITPSASALGTIAGQLTWNADAPDAPFLVPVTLDYIEEGTALSPAKLAFGTITLEARSPQQKITLENCSAEPADVKIEQLVGVQGSIDAWDVQPVLTTRTLGRRDRFEVAVRFQPRRPGLHVARLRIFLGDEERTVELIGDGDGVVRDPRSLYACDCAAGGSPWQALPIIGVLLVVLRRRPVGRAQRAGNARKKTC